MRKLTPKQEKFAQVYVETSNATEAYRQAYNTKSKNEATINREALRIKEHPTVAPRITELLQEAMQSHRATLDDLLVELQEAREMAVEVRNPNAMNAATMGKAKLLGLDQGTTDGEDVAQPLEITFTVKPAKSATTTTNAA